MRATSLSRIATDDPALNRLQDQWLAALNPMLRELAAPPRYVVALPIPALSAIAEGDVVWRFTPGHAGRLRAVSFYVTTPATTADRVVTIRPCVAGVAVTGGRLVLTTANCTPKGASVEAAAIVGATFTATDELTGVASDVTAFSEGAGAVVLAFG